MKKTASILMFLLLASGALYAQTETESVIDTNLGLTADPGEFSSADSTTINVKMYRLIGLDSTITPIYDVTTNTFTYQANIDLPTISEDPGMVELQEITIAGKLQDYYIEVVFLNATGSIKSKVKYVINNR
jgi:hypothetical protein